MKFVYIVYDKRSLLHDVDYKNTDCLVAVFEKEEHARVYIKDVKKRYLTNPLGIFKARVYNKIIYSPILPSASGDLRLTMEEL